MQAWRRYAAYFAPRPETGLARLTAAWLGWDPEAGAPTGGLEVDGLPAPRETLVAAPARYGFHGTLKAPFRLAGRASAEALAAEARAIAAMTAPFDLRLALRPASGFLALVPEGGTARIDALAETCVRRLDRFRAPLTAEEIARRRPGRLTPRQARRLAEWGYPFVFEEFRFHLTLTGGLDPAALEATARALGPHLAPMIAAPVPVRDLCLFGEAADGRFAVVSRLPLLG